MRSFPRFLGAVALLASIGGSALAQDCRRPSNPPAVPDGGKATVDQFKAAHSLILVYVQALAAYKNCLDAKIKQLPQGSRPDVAQKLRDEGGNALDEGKSLSSAYMDQVKIFKTVGKGAAPAAH